MAAHPEIPSRLLIGDDRVSANPKLNNVVKGWKAARRDWIVIANSNVLMPRDYIQRLMKRWRADTGIVCAPPLGARPESFAAEIECAFLNTYQARWQYSAEALGFGFAQGKTMLWRRDVLEAGGGIEALGAEIAEDAASTKLVHRADLRAHLASPPSQQPLGVRRLRDVWARQVRWARLRRATFPLYFAPEIVTTSLLTLAAAAIGGEELGVSAPAAAYPRGGDLVRRRSGARRRRRLAARLVVARRLDGARRAVAGVVAQRLDERPLRLARQRHVGRRGDARRRRRRRGGRLKGLARVRRPIAARCAPVLR